MFWLYDNDGRDTNTASSNDNINDSGPNWFRMFFWLYIFDKAISNNKEEEDEETSLGDIIWGLFVIACIVGAIFWIIRCSSEKKQEQEVVKTQKVDTAPVMQSVDEYENILSDITSIMTEPDIISEMAESEMMQDVTESAEGFNHTEKYKPAESSSRTDKPTEEMSTLEMLERRSHANAVESARRAGVSTEGSTLDILERISHANAVESAKRAGVSTEGSTLDILERISHANAVESAKRTGVSTEGSTLDILERISRKHLED